MPPQPWAGTIDTQTPDGCYRPAPTSPDGVSILMPRKPSPLVQLDRHPRASTAARTFRALSRRRTRLRPVLQSTPARLRSHQAPEGRTCRRCVLAHAVWVYPSAIRCGARVVLLVGVRCTAAARLAQTTSTGEERTSARTDGYVRGVSAGLTAAVAEHQRCSGRRPTPASPPVTSPPLDGDGADNRPDNLDSSG